MFIKGNRLQSELAIENSTSIIYQYSAIFLRRYENVEKSKQNNTYNLICFIDKPTYIETTNYQGYSRTILYIVINTSSSDNITRPFDVY